MSATDLPRAHAIEVIRRLPRPLSISFSMGRTSGLMLRLFLDAYDGELPEDVVVLTANTGKEDPASLDFWLDCRRHWNVPITMLEWDPDGTDAQETRVVSHNSCSRDGEPFERLITQRNMLPNPVTRFCTEILKVRTMARYCRDALGWKTWNVAIGYRADEPQRVAKLRQCGKDDVWQLALSEEFGQASPSGKRHRGNRDGHIRHAPLAKAGITRRHVRDFWLAQPFDLRLMLTDKGTTPHGNCDLCFLKGAETIAGLIREKPERADWWIAQEEKGAAFKHSKEIRNPAICSFRKDRPSYAEIKDIMARQGDLQDEGYGDLEGMACACTD